MATVGQSILVDMIALLVIPILLTLGVALEFIAGRRCQASIEKWASRNHYQLQSVKRRWLSLGPWQWGSNRARRVFDLTVTDEQGGERTGLARIGGGIGGVVADDIEVRWQ